MTFEEWKWVYREQGRTTVVFCQSLLTGVNWIVVHFSANSVSIGIANLGECSLILSGIGFIVSLLFVCCYGMGRMHLCNNGYSTTFVTLHAMLSHLAAYWLWSVSAPHIIEFELVHAALMLNIVLQSVTVLCCQSQAGLHPAIVGALHLYYLIIWILFIVSTFFILSSRYSVK